MRKKKRNIIIGTAAAAVLVSAGVFWFISGRDSSSSGSVYVQKVSDFTSDIVYVQRFSGVVKSQDSVKVKKDSSKEVEEIYVEEGDPVKAGDKLFKYSTDEAEKDYDLAKLDLEEIDNNISAYSSEVAELQSARKTASEEMKLDYATQISEKQTTIRQLQYDRQAKQKEIENLKKAIDNAVVYSSVSGTIEALNEEGGYDNYGNEKPFISISQTGDLRVKGSLDEMSFGTISAGQSVIVRSRTDETVTWTGTVTEVSQEPETDENSYYYYDSGETSSKYPFYVSLDTSNDLLLGQHVYIEPDYGQTSAADGVWLDEAYIAYDEDGNAYVWMSRNGKLRKQTVETGEMDENTWMIEIVSGLSEDDYIAWPDESYTEGMTTVSAEDQQGE